MRLKILLLGLFLLTAPTFTAAQNDRRNAPQRASGARVSREEAIEIAKRSALAAYRSLEQFDVETRETKKRWIVVFELRDKSLDGGAPYYEISKKTGVIVKARYYQ